MTICEAVRIGPLRLPGEFAAAVQPLGLVVLAHGCSGSRHSPRHRFVAGALHGYRLGTLLLDLLTEPEAADRAGAPDIALLAGRLGHVLDWAQSRPDFLHQRIGLFGANTCAAAALRTAVEHPGRVAAVVSRGGRTDLADAQLPAVRAPTLLVVGGDDTGVLELNRQALRRLRCNKRLEVVPGASHRFEEPGALDSVAHLAGTWFVRHLATGRRP